MERLLDWLNLFLTVEKQDMLTAWNLGVNLERSACVLLANISSRGVDSVYPFLSWES